MKKTWTTSERQGSGRRYWFETVEATEAFVAAKRAAGKRVLHDTRIVPTDTNWKTLPLATCWVADARRKTVTTTAMFAGLDPA